MGSPKLQRGDPFLNELSNHPKHERSTKLSF
jgi:hypothetical protein